MILSASVNADVPARFGHWFRQRLHAGFLRVAGSDPWRQHRIELNAEHVDGIVFWTRDCAEFLPVLDELRERAIAFVVQYAWTRARTSAQSARAIETMRVLSARYGPRSVVWRYDPVAIDTAAGPAKHNETFRGLAAALRGVLDEVTIAFARPRVAARRSADVASRGHAEPAHEQAAKRELTRQFAGIAAACDMRLSVCADIDALVPGSAPARCIDARRLSELAGRTLEVASGGFMRDCLCARSIDIGNYGGNVPEAFCGRSALCPRAARHDPSGEFLLKPRRSIKRLNGAALPF
jgi:hypothetical protein